MTSHWNSVRPTVRMVDGRIFTVPDYIAFNWMRSGSACSHIRYCFCVHPDLAQAGDDHWQYDAFWYEWIDVAQTGEEVQP